MWCWFNACLFYLKLVLGHSKVLVNVVIYLRHVIRKKKINNIDTKRLCGGYMFVIPSKCDIRQTHMIRIIMLSAVFRWMLIRIIYQNCDWENARSQRSSRACIIIELIKCLNIAKPACKDQRYIVKFTFNKQRPRSFRSIQV